MRVVKKTKVLIPSPIRSLQMALLQNFYETTLEALREAKNDRLWFKTNTKLGKLYFDREDYGKLQRILKQLHQSCQVSRIDIAVVATLLLLIQTTCHHYRPQRSWGKVMFLQASVILSTGGEYTPPGSGTPPRSGTPPGTRYTPRDQVHPPDQVNPPRSGTPPGPGTPTWTRYTPL